MNKFGGNNMCLAILVILAIFLMYQLLCKSNKTVGGDGHENVEDTTNVVQNDEVIESDTELESESDLGLDEPVYGNYEPVVQDNNQEVEVSAMQDNNVEVLPEKTVEEEVVNNNADEYKITGLEDSDEQIKDILNALNTASVPELQKMNFS